MLDDGMYIYKWIKKYRSNIPVYDANHEIHIIIRTAGLPALIHKFKGIVMKLGAM